MKFRTGVIAIGSVFILNIVLTTIFLKAGVYSQFEWVDIPMHLLGGLSVAILGISLWKKNHEPKWMSLLFVVGLTMIAGVLWELMEFGIDQYLHRTYGLPSMALRDTLKDLLNDGIGALISWIIFF